MTKRKMLFRIITASLLRRKSRMIVALLAIAVGATILSGLVTIYYDVPRQLESQFRNYGANMIVSAKDDSFTEEDLESVEDLIDKNSLVGAAAYRYVSVRIHEQPIMLAGTNMENVQKTSPYWMIDGQWPTSEKEMLVGKNVAESLGISTGDKVTITYTPEDKTQLDATVDLTVTGIINTGGNEEEYVYVDMSQVTALTGESDKIDLAELSVSASSDKLKTLKEEINEKIPSVNASLVKRVTASETTVLSKLQGLVFITTAVVLALTMICVATTMTAVVSERRKEIGLRKALGASDGSLIKEFMGEGIILGIIGGLIGAFLGFGFAQIVSVNVFGSYITLRIALVPATVGISVVITAIACLIPIRSATKIDPALVLKGE